MVPKTTPLHASHFAFLNSPTNEPTN
jgi:hypothetical protein